MRKGFAELDLPRRFDIVQTRPVPVVIESIDLEISRPLTVLIGENGSGKSTVVECLELLRKAAADLSLGVRVEDAAAELVDLGRVRRREEPRPGAVKKGGLGLSVAEDADTLAALERLVARVLDAPVARLKEPYRLDARFGPVASQDDSARVAVRVLPQLPFHNRPEMEGHK